MSEHSPLPFKAAQTFVENKPPTWNVYTPRNGKRFNGDCVAVCDNQIDAEFIVRACNAYDDLLAACKAVAAALDRIQQDGSIVWLGEGPVHESASERLAWVIAKAEGKSDA